MTKTRSCEKRMAKKKKTKERLVRRNVKLMTQRKGHSDDEDHEETNEKRKQKSIVEQETKKH